MALLSLSISSFLFLFLLCNFFDCSTLSNRTNNIAQQVKAFATKLAALSSISGDPPGRRRELTPVGYPPLTSTLGLECAYSTSGYQAKLLKWFLPEGKEPGILSGIPQQVFILSHCCDHNSGCNHLRGRKISFCLRYTGLSAQFLGPCLWETTMERGGGEKFLPCGRQKAERDTEDKGPDRVFKDTGPGSHFLQLGTASGQLYSLSKEIYKLRTRHSMHRPGRWGDTSQVTQNRLSSPSLPRTLPVFTTGTSGPCTWNQYPESQ